MRWRNTFAVTAVLSGLVVAAVFAASPGGRGVPHSSPSPLSAAAGWSGLVGGPRAPNGFWAVLAPRAIALLERTPGVKGVSPVGVAFPASVSSAALRAAAASGQRPDVRLAGIAGRGVTVALLETGVDLDKAYLH